MGKGYSKNDGKLKRNAIDKNLYDRLNDIELLEHVNTNSCYLDFTKEVMTQIVFGDNGYIINNICNLMQICIDLQLNLNNNLNEYSTLNLQINDQVFVLDEDGNYTQGIISNISNYYKKYKSRPYYHLYLLEKKGKIKYVEHNTLDFYDNVSNYENLYCIRNEKTRFLWRDYHNKQPKNLIHIKYNDICEDKINETKYTITVNGCDHTFEWENIYKGNNKIAILYKYIELLQNIGKKYISSNSFENTNLLQHEYNYRYTHFIRRLPSTNEGDDNLYTSFISKGIGGQGKIDEPVGDKKIFTFSWLHNKIKINDLVHDLSRKKNITHNYNYITLFDFYNNLEYKLNGLRSDAIEKMKTIKNEGIKHHYNLFIIGNIGNQLSKINNQKKIIKSFNGKMNDIYQNIKTFIGLDRTTEQGIKQSESIINIVNSSIANISHLYAKSK